MVKIDDVKKVMNNLVQDKTVMKLKEDESFLATVAQLYNEYVEESDGEPNWSLEDYTINKIDWLENN